MHEIPPMDWPDVRAIVAETAETVKPMLNTLFAAMNETMSEAQPDKGDALALNVLINLIANVIASVAEGDREFGAAVIDAIARASKAHLDIACAAMDRNLEEALDTYIADGDMAEAGALIERLRGRP